MFFKSVVFLVLLLFPCQAKAAESFSVFEARPTAMVVETDGPLLNATLQQQLVLKYQWAFRFPIYDKQTTGGFVAHKKGDAFLQDNRGRIFVSAVREYMHSKGLQRLVLLRVDALSSFTYQDLSEEEELEEARVDGVATLVNLEGEVLSQRKIHRWEQQVIGVDSGPDVLLLAEWERFLDDVKAMKN